MVQVPIQLCAGCDSNVRKICDPTSNITDTGLANILLERRSDRRAVMVENLAQTLMTKFGKLSDENKELKH